MTDVVESLARPADTAVTPELALVDPELAKMERARLVLHTPRPRPPQQLTWSPERPATDDGLYRVPEIATRIVARAVSLARRRPRRALAGAAVSLVVVAMVLPNVRVDVGGSSRSTLSEGGSVGAGMPKGSGGQNPSIAGNESPAAPRRFAWAPVKGAEGYHVELFLGSERVFSADSHAPSITVPARWTHRGMQRSLTPGEYQWYVWPKVSGLRGRNAVVQAKVVVTSA